MKRGFFTSPESKQQSLQWHHTHSPRTQKFKTSISVKKIMVSVFWDRKGILLVDFMPPGATINADAYCDTLTRLRAIQNKSRGMLSRGVRCSTAMHGPMPRTSPLRSWKNSSGIYWTIHCAVRTLLPAISTCLFT